MGCAQSNNNDVRRESLYGRRNTLVVKPHVNVKVGGGIRFEDIHGTKIIFIFGKLTFCFTNSKFYLGTTKYHQYVIHTIHTLFRQLCKYELWDFIL